MFRKVSNKWLSSRWHAAPQKGPFETAISRILINRQFFMWFIVLSLVLILVSPVDALDCSNYNLDQFSGPCNMTKYKNWKNEKYTGILSTDSTFWRYQSQQEFVLTNGLALELATPSCKNRFQLLFDFKAGRSGPVNIQSGYDVMCSEDCLESDELHIGGMCISGCTCLELSTSVNEGSFRVEGDWCLENTARQLCTMTGYCGIWNCRIDDFMCPRYEFNKRTIDLRGPGHCNSASAVKTSWILTFLLLVLSFCHLFQ